MVKAARRSLPSKKLPLRLWAEAVAYAVYTLNRTLSSTGKVTPYQTWNGGKPNISHLRIFGSKAFIHIPDSIRRKLDPKGREVTFRGCSESSKGYRVLIPESQKVQISFLMKTTRLKSDMNLLNHQLCLFIHQRHLHKTNRRKMISCQPSV